MISYYPCQNCKNKNCKRVCKKIKNFKKQYKKPYKVEYIVNIKSDGE